MHISYNLFKLEGALTFQVTHQSAALTKYLQRIGQFKSSNGWVIKTDISPSIDMETQTIYLQGIDEAKDLRPAVVYGMRNSTRNEVVSEIYTAIKELSAAITETQSIHIIFPSFASSEFKPISHTKNTNSVQYITL